ncbi:MAG TPA: hypothetical protein VJ735_04310 [Actinomycetes bacterium]|nr:hypothetical protein [Actinomycetes bacterium]
MELLWLVLSLLAVDLAALLFAADTRPGFQHSSRRALHLPFHPGLHESARPRLAHLPGWSNSHVPGSPDRRSNKG